MPVAHSFLCPQLEVPQSCQTIYSQTKGVNELQAHVPKLPFPNGRGAQSEYVSCGLCGDPGCWCGCRLREVKAPALSLHRSLPTAPLLGGVPGSDLFVESLFNRVTCLGSC